MKISTKPSPPTTRFDPGSTPAPPPAPAPPAVVEAPAWAEEAPAHRRGAGGGGALARLRAWAARRSYALLVLLPTLAAGLYMFGVAADQYVSEARFVVRARSAASTASPLGELLGSVGFAPAQQEAASVREYLGSHDAVRALHGKLDLIALYRRPEADILARLWWEDPERLLRHYASMTTAVLDGTTGVTTLRVRAFRPEDARRVAEELLLLSEALVNHLSERAREDTLRVARAEVATAEARVAAAREALTRFREREQAVDPTRSAAIAIETIGQLDGQLTAARAELTAKSAYMRADNPGLLEVRNRIAALERQAAAERARHTARGATVTQQLAGYERLLLERDFADRQLASATASLETARVEAQRQQIFLARVVEPNLAEYPLHPRRTVIVITIFAGLSLAYAVSWLLIAGMREHAA